MTLVYVDTCVYVNAANPNETGHKESETFFFDSISCKCRVAISDWAKTELSGHLQGKLGMMFLMMRKQEKFVDLETEEEDYEKVDAYTGENANDYHHVVLALKAGAACLITWNVKHFKAWSHLIEIKTPTEFNAS